MQQEQEKRRKWLEKYAKERGFDPLVPDNWYSQTISSISSVKVFLSLPLSLSISPFSYPNYLKREVLQYLNIIKTVSLLLSFMLSLTLASKKATFIELILGQ